LPTEKNGLAKLQGEKPTAQNQLNMSNKISINEVMILLDGVGKPEVLGGVAKMDEEGFLLSE